MAISNRSALMLILTDKNKGVSKLPPPRTFNQMLAMEFRRQLLVTRTGAEKFTRNLADYIFEVQEKTPEFSEDFIASNVVTRLCKPSMTVKTFRLGLRIIGVQQADLAVVLRITAENEHVPDAADGSGYNLTHDDR
jgi:hypothetical protein